MTMKQSRHNKIVEELEDKVKKYYEKTYKYVEYSWRNGEGEIDLIGYKGDGVYTVYEVKCNYNHKTYVKATEQLWRAKEFLTKVKKAKKVNLIYVSPKYVDRLG